MKTPISPHNPFGHTRYGFAFEHLTPGSRCLDYGCARGDFLAQVRATIPIDYVGVDRNRLNETTAAEDRHVVHIASPRTPFADGTFDTVTLLDVIEHVHDQLAVLQELLRVLKPSGHLIVTVPRKHVFSFLDLGNLKFRFPRLHKAFIVARHSSQHYRDHYEENPDGLFGDVEALKGWHEHFSEADLTALLARAGFEVEVTDGSGLFVRPLVLLDVLKLGFLVPGRLRELDLACFAAMNLYCVARKPVLT
jgi:SAM-dependent methyltransferase